MCLGGQGGLVGPCGQGVVKVVGVVTGQGGPGGSGGQPDDMHLENIWF